MCGVVRDGVVHDAIPKKFSMPAEPNGGVRAFNRAWKKDVHLLPINWRPASNGFVIWSRQLRISRPSSPSSRRPSHIRRRSSPSNKSGCRIPGATGEGRRATAVLQAGDVRPTSRAVCTLARSDVAVRARSRRGTGYQAGDHSARHQCGFAAASDSTKATTTEDRVPAILGTSADRVSAASGGIALRLLRAAADHHPHPRHEAGGDGRGKDIRGRRGAVHLRLFRTATTARRCRPPRGRRRPWRKAPSGRASWPGW